MEYDVVVAIGNTVTETVTKLTTQVNTMMGDGWLTSGSITPIPTDQISIILLQPITRDAE